MKGTKADYIAYRIEKARQMLHDAEILISQERWNSAINRLYYAGFHAVNALLFSRDITARTHSGVKTKFFQEFIATGIINKAFGELFSDLQDWRQEGDYADFIDFEQETVEPLPQKVNDLIVCIEGLLLPPTNI